MKELKLAVTLEKAHFNLETDVYFNLYDLFKTLTSVFYSLGAELEPTVINCL